MGPEEEEREARRPKVVDRRISAGGHTPPPKPTPPEEPPPPPPAPETPPVRPLTDQPTAPGEPPVWTPEQEEQARRMVEEIVRTPSLDWVLNAAVNLANVAGTKIEMGAAADAQLAIDALATLVSGLSGRLQDAEAPLKQTLAQLQMAYADRVAKAATPPPPEN